MMLSAGARKNNRAVFETTGTGTVLIENDGMISLANSEFEWVSRDPER